MNKKIILFAGITGIIIIAIVSMFFLKNSVQGEELPPITEAELNGVFNIIKEHTAKVLIEDYGDFLKKDSLINLIHIIKTSSGYKYSCLFGGAYETANLYRLFPEEIVSVGQITQCNAEAAKAIDDAINLSFEKNMDCRIFITDLDGGLRNLTDYYFFNITMEEIEVTQEMVDRTQDNKCLSPIKNLIGENISRFMTGVVDLKKGALYF